MIKHLLSAAAAVFLFQAAATAQCTPNPQYADSTFGVWPDTTENLPCAFADQTSGYNAVIDLKTLTDTAVSVTVGGFPLNIVAYIQKFRVNSITGLPTGFQAIPNVNEWVNGGTAPNFTAVQGCMSILANQASVQDIITANPGGIDIPLTVVVDAYISSTDNSLANTILAGNWLSDLTSIPGISAIPVSGYKLKIRPSQADGCGPLSVELVAPWADGMAVNPNPVMQSGMLQFELNRPENLQLEVVNTLGQVMERRTIAATAGINRVELATGNYPAGVYFYTLRNDRFSATRSFVSAN